MLLADDRGIESVGGRRKRVDSREQAERRNATRKNRGGIEVRKRRGRRRVGQVVCGDVDSLDGGNGARLGRGNALLEVAHLGCQRGLVTNGGRHTAQQCGNLGTCLGEAEDVVDEQQNVLAAIAEVLSGGKAGQTDAQTRSGRLVHLTIDQAGLVDNARLAHLEEQVGALAGTLADAGEHRGAAVLLGEVVDELLDQNGLADAGAAEQTCLAAADVGLEQVDGLDAGLEDLGLGGELVETGRCMVDGVELLHLGHGLAVDGLAHDVPNAAERLGTNGHLHGLTGIGGDEAALQAVGRGHGDRADDAARKLALDLEDRAQMTDRGLGLDRERVVDRGHRAVKLDVDDRADDSHDATITGSRLLGGFLDRKLYGVISHYCSSNAEAPPTISLISVVIEAWRTRLYVRVRVEMIAVAFSVAECMALRRAPCSAAAESIRAW